jgi:hypothetical protein
MRISVVLICAVSALLVFVLSGQSGLSQTKKGSCGKAPKLVFQPTLSKEDVAMISSSSLTGRVAVIINEDGTVTAPKVLAATPKQGAQILYDAVVLAKFEPRAGCGPLKIDFIFNLNNK